jgi:hypothetical protein
VAKAGSGTAAVVRGGLGRNDPEQK